MNAYSEAFYRYIREHPLKYCDVEIESILQMFYECYAEGAGRDCGREGERQAFLEGFRVGARWAMEIRQI